ncbi:hypothetical protein HPP92_008304 [Vanilla planifolia]|uniref:UDP-glycosyltransferases domain-containing protein n=1 Tax=Vanilla planifolia TaxID=51239 RepID=A0A835V597_VANPL|nr:hypothetical protein HPP92_008304 [Vanilla planifolia]
MLPSQFSDPKKISPIVAGLNSMFEQALEVERKSMGMVFNSFYELEPDYVEHFRNVMGRKAWHIGPLMICNREDSLKSSTEESSRKEGCLKWLDDQRPGSVLYVCFGSMGDLSAAQQRELALGLEASGHPFVLAVRNESGEGIPEGFDEAVEGRGLVIREWAPQLLILNHRAVGGFLTHCGWNSSLEGISAGLPFVTWPYTREQFYNERLLVDLLEIGVAVGSKVYTMNPEERPVVEAEKLEAAVKRLMGDSEEAKERRRRARALGDKARAAVDLGGSSYNDLSNLMQEIMRAKRGS